MTDAIIRGSQNGFVKYASEAGMIALGATSVGSLPGSFNLAGWCDLPSVNRSRGTQGIEGVGSYRDVDIVAGAKTTQMGINMRLADPQLLRYALRDTDGINAGLSDCQPVLALLTGATNPCGQNKAFTHALRYAMVNTLSFQAQENQPMTVALQLMAVADDRSTNVQTVDGAALNAIPKTLTWFHMDWLVGGVSYRQFLKSVSVQINNNITPQGSRPEGTYGDPLSCAPYGLLPGNQSLSVSYQLRDVPDFMQDATGRLDWGTVVLTATNTTSLGYSPNTHLGQTVTIAIANNRLNNDAMEAVTPGQPFGFSADTVSNTISITVS